MATLLLIDDDPLVRNVMEKVLVRAGFDVLATGSGPEAILANRMHAGDIALVVSDLQMPAMSGQETVRQLLLERPSLRVVYVSGFCDEALPELDPEHRVSTYLAKPFPMAQLVQTVRAMLA